MNCESERNLVPVKRNKKENPDPRILTISYYSSYCGLIIGLFEIQKIGYYKNVEGSEKRQFHSIREVAIWDREFLEAAPSEKGEPAIST